MLKSVGKFCFLIVSIAILVVLFTVAWRDSTKPEIEMDVGFSVTETTETIPLSEKTISTEPSEVADTGEVTQVATEKVTEEATVKTTVIETTTEKYIETVVWVEDDAPESSTTEKGENS